MEIVDIEAKHYCLVAGFKLMVEIKMLEHLTSATTFGSLASTFAFQEKFTVSMKDLKAYRGHLIIDYSDTLS